MAITSKIVKRSKLGNAFMNIVDLTITEETYTTGGLTITPPKLGVGYTYVVMPAPAAGYIFEYDHDYHKLKAFTAVGAIENHTHSNSLTGGQHSHANTLGNAAHTHINELAVIGNACTTENGAINESLVTAGGAQTELDETAGGNTTTASVGTITEAELAGLSVGDEIQFDAGENAEVFTKAGETDETAREFSNQAGLISCINDVTHGIEGWTASESGDDTLITADADGAENNDIKIFHNEPATATILQATFDAMKIGDGIEFGGKKFTKTDVKEVADREFTNQADFAECFNDSTVGVDDWTAAANDDVVITSDITGVAFNDEVVSIHTRAIGTILEAIFTGLSTGDRITFAGNTYTKAGSTSVEDKEFANQVGFALCVDDLTDWEAEEDNDNVVITAAVSGATYNDEVAEFYQVGGRHTHDNVFTSETEIRLMSYSQPNVKGSKNTDHENADDGDTPTNHDGISAESVVSTTWTRGTITHPDVPRNIGIVIKNDTAGALNLYEGVMTFTVTGTFRGEQQTELITFTSTSGNKSVSNGGTDSYRVKYGVKPFDTVTDITLDNLPDDDFTISACPGSKIGLPNDLATPTEGELIKITKTDVDFDPTSSLDSSNMTVDLGVLVNEDSFTIVYNGVNPLTAAGLTNTEKQVTLLNDTQTVTINNVDETVSLTNAAAGSISATTATEVGDGTAITASPRLIAIGT